LLHLKNRSWILIVAIALFSLVASCARRPVEETASVSPLESPLQPASSIPTPPAATSAPTELVATVDVSAPESGKGTAVGTIYDESRGEPYSGQFIYLAKVIELGSQDGDEPPVLFAELDVRSDPFDQTDEQGRFVIENVEPGLYALAVRLPDLRETLLYDAETEVNLSVEIEPDEISDIGTVRIMGPR